MNEIWISIDDRYSVSNFGRIKSSYANKEKILKPFKDAGGYLKVDLRSKGKRKTMSVHRLVALAFIPNPNNLPEINHKDENKENNYVDNLEWCTAKYNCNYGTRIQRKSENCKKPVCSVDGSGNVAHYNSIMEASKFTGISKTSISKSLSDNFSCNKTAGGMLWFYDNGNIEQIVKDENIKANTNKRSICSIDANDHIEHYDSIAEARKKTGVNNIHRAINNKIMAGNRRWFYCE